MTETHNKEIKWGTAEEARKLKEKYYRELGLKITSEGVTWGKHTVNKDLAKDVLACSATTEVTR
jgi:hypothetical protein